MKRPAPFVWIRQRGCPRVTHVYFRRGFKLKGNPGSARLNIFAHTHYHLRVNGQLIGTGPARSYPDFPEYDVYDLKDYLKKGENVVAVHVAHTGKHTFHHLFAPGVFTAWGTVKSPGGDVSLSTASDWLCQPSRAHLKDVPDFSFAIGPIEICDLRKAPAGWDRPGTPSGKWTVPVPLADTSAWGRLRKRSIPHLTQESLRPLELLGAYPHTDEERIYSFRMMQPIDPDERLPPDVRGFAATWIHSPRKQRVTVGTYWGEHCLNGREVDRLPEKPTAMGREDMRLNLKEGWNFFFVSYGFTQAKWEFHMAVPTDAGLVLSADKTKDGRIALRTAGPLPKDEARAIVKRGAPASLDDVPELDGLWHDEPLQGIPVSPCKGMAWASFGRPLAVETDADGAQRLCVAQDAAAADHAAPIWVTRNIRIPAGQDVSLIFDMGTIQLGRIMVDLDAPSGTVVDVGGAEELMGDRPWHYKKQILESGDRFITRNGHNRWETFARRGLRYLQVTLRNHSQAVTLHDVGMVSEVYPYEPRGSFECSDEWFNTLWRYGWQTLRICSEDVITDCPWRERTLYGGDLLPEAATTAVAAGDLRLVRRCVDVFLQSYSPESHWLQSMAPMDRTRNPLYDYPLIVILIADWLCRLTGDTAFARRCVPIFRRMLARGLPAMNEAGLYVADCGLFVDWVKKQRTGCLCTLNVLVARAFDAFASLLRQIDRDDEAASMDRQGARLRSATQKHFWDAETGAFADSLQDGKLSAEHGVAANAWMLAWGDLPAAQADSVLQFLRGIMVQVDARAEGKRSRFVSTYGAFYLLGGLYEHGDEAAAEEWIRRLYSEMVRDPSGTIWEGPTREGSLAHAWSTAPSYYMATRALGVRMGFPDAATPDDVLIAPQADSLEWARGSVPHPLGDIGVDWAVRGDCLYLSYCAPRGVRVRVAPVGRLGAMKRIVTAERYQT